MDVSGIEKRARELEGSRKTLLLGTVGQDGTPTASYAPFVLRETVFYIYTSGLSRHTNDLLQVPRASVLLIKDEADSLDNLFARERITFTCHSVTVPRGSVEWESILNAFETKFGTKLFSMIRPLSDFVLTALMPTEAIFVEGFGRAYCLDTNLSNPVHVRGTGPGARPVN